MITPLYCQGGLGQQNYIHQHLRENKQETEMISILEVVDQCETLLV